jgi:hypothetical protein
MVTWKDVIGWEGFYKVSSDGKVKSISRLWSPKETILKSSKKVYERVGLSRKQKVYWISVHRIVARAFLGEPHGLQVNHKNGNKFDNRVENLEYCTPKENMLHAYKIGLRKKYFGEEHCGSKLDKKKVKFIRSYPKIRGSSAFLAKKYNVSHGTIYRILYNQIWVGV